ncbi:MAG: hypothetical protein WA902_24945 [Thermosynechococcaceae cyanobacterium]
MTKNSRLKGIASSFKMLPRSEVVQLGLPVYLSLYGLSFGFVGWTLSLANVVAYGVASLTLLTLYWVACSQDWFYGLMGRTPQALSVILLISLCMSALVTYPRLVLVLILPAISTFLAWQELSYCHYPMSLRFSALVSIGLLGLVLGEIIDLFYLHRPLY